MKLPPTIAAVIPGAILMSDGQSFMPRAEMRPAEAERFPELVIENNLSDIREAALTSMRSLLILTNTLQLFSFDDLFREASEQLTRRTKELEDGLLTKLPTIAETGDSSDDAFWDNYCLEDSSDPDDLSDD